LHILGRNADKLEKAKKAAPEFKDFCIYRCDVSDKEMIDEVFDAIKGSWGCIYGVVNSAAINPSRNDIVHTDYQDWKDTLNAISNRILQLLSESGGSNAGSWRRKHCEHLLS
jgi:enoyl-[acyl-carrier-protein] reductase (NADH)